MCLTVWSSIIISPLCCYVAFILTDGLYLVVLPLYLLSKCSSNCGLLWISWIFFFVCFFQTSGSSLVIHCCCCPLLACLLSVAQEFNRFSFPGYTKILYWQCAMFVQGLDWFFFLALLYMKRAFFRYINNVCCHEQKSIFSSRQNVVPEQQNSDFEVDLTLI